jgi:hypothetical protein
MSLDIYRKLAQHLDDLPAGFPSTESGVELRILQRLFTPERAELALHLTLFPEEAELIASRAEIDPEEAAQRLEKMAKKGLIYSIQRDGMPPKYRANQYIVGIWEFSVNTKTWTSTFPHSFMRPGRFLSYVLSLWAAA